MALACAKGRLAVVAGGVDGGEERRVAVAVVVARVARGEPGGVDGDDGVGRQLDEAQLLGAAEDGLLRAAEGPPFSASTNRRRAA